MTEYNELKIFDYTKLPTYFIQICKVILYKLAFCQSPKRNIFLEKFIENNL